MGQLGRRGGEEIDQRPPVIAERAVILPGIVEGFTDFTHELDQFRIDQPDRRLLLFKGGFGFRRTLINRGQQIMGLGDLWVLRLEFQQLFFGLFPHLQLKIKSG